MTKKCVLIDGIIYCQCGDQSSHYGTMGERGAREVRCEPSPTQVPSKELFSDRFSITCCMGENADGCACGFTEERALRAVIDGRRSMTGDERAWCSDQIASVEGHEAPPADWSDVDVARGVLSAWMDYCRDKGLL